jgi:hypothetical protein
VGANANIPVHVIRRYAPVTRDDFDDATSLEIVSMIGHARTIGEPLTLYDHRCVALLRGEITIEKALETRGHR